MTAEDILTALKSVSDDKLWATELSLFGGERRIDFWTLEPQMSKGWRATSYEIKVTRQDFMNDTWEKQEGAIAYSDRFFYVTPDGMLSKKEIPEWAGLMTWDGKEFHVKKRAPKLEKLDPDWAFLAALVRGSREVRRDTVITTKQIRFLEWELKRYKKAEELRTKRAFTRWSKQQAWNGEQNEIKILGG